MDTCGLTSCFTDLSIKQKLYPIKMTINKKPHWLKNEEDEAIATVVSRSWNDSFQCLHCTSNHSIFYKDNFGLILSDMHMPAKIPAYDGDCIATICLHNMSLGQLTDLTLYQIVKGLGNKSKEGVGYS